MNMAKTKITTKTTSKKSSIPKLEVDDDSSMNIRKIENGFIVSESGQKGKGRNKEWYNKDYFAKTRQEAGQIVSKGIGGVKFGGKK